MSSLFVLKRGGLKGYVGDHLPCVLSRVTRSGRSAVFGDAQTCQIQTTINPLLCVLVLSRSYAYKLDVLDGL